MTDKTLRERLDAGERLLFPAFMEAALYGPDGYYRQRTSPIGGGGDFVTGSSYSPLLGRTTARLLERLGERAELLEVGCGDGRHLAAVHEAAPHHRLRGFDRVERELPAGIEQVADLNTLDDAGVVGIVFSYELFDAFPVHRLCGLAGGDLGELAVGRDDSGELGFFEVPLSDPGLASLVPSGLEPGQIADVTPAWGEVYGRLARLLRRGLLVTFDYGYRRERLFDARIRRHGTLACYRRHHVHRDVFRDIGRQDLTAHVDFTTLEEVGEAAGLQTEAWTRQALWLAANGIFDDLARADPQVRMEARMLLDGDGMGEDIRVLVQSRGIDAAELWNREIC